MDPHPTDADTFGDAPVPDSAGAGAARSSGPTGSSDPDAIVLAEQGDTHQQFLHDIDRVEARRDERELHALAQRYAAYAESTPDPRTFDEFVSVIRSIHG